MFIAYTKTPGQDYRFSIESEHPATYVIMIGENSVSHPIWFSFKIPDEHTVWFKIPDEHEFAISIALNKEIGEIIIYIPPSVSEWEDYTVEIINDINYNASCKYGNPRNFKGVNGISNLTNTYTVKNFNLDDEFSVKKEKYHARNRNDNSEVPILYTFTRKMQHVLK